MTELPRPRFLNTIDRKGRDSMTEPRLCPKCGSEMKQEYHFKDRNRRESAKPFWICQSCGYWPGMPGHEEKLGGKEIVFDDELRRAEAIDKGQDY